MAGTPVGAGLFNVTGGGGVGEAGRIERVAGLSQVQQVGRRKDITRPGRVKLLGRVGRDAVGLAVLENGAAARPLS